MAPETSRVTQMESAQGPQGEDLENFSHVRGLSLPILGSADSEAAFEIFILLSGVYRRIF